MIDRWSESLAIAVCVFDRPKITHVCLENLAKSKRRARLLIYDDGSTEFTREWLKNFGHFEDGTGSGSDKIAPLVGIGWLPTQQDFLITLVQYFYSYTENSGAPSVSQTGPRLIYIRAIPPIRGWLKADWKMAIDHKDDDDFSSTMEFQLGTMFTPRIGVYLEALLGDDVFDTKLYDVGVGAAVRFMY